MRNSGRLEQKLPLPEFEQDKFKVLEVLRDENNVKLEVVEDKVTLEKFALKTIMMNDSQTEKARVSEMKAAYLGFMKKLSQMKSRNVLEYIDVKESGKEIKILMKLAKGNFVNYTKTNPYFSAKANAISRHLFYSIIPTLHELRQQERLFFLNLKPENILVFGDGSKMEDFKISLGDMGFGFYGVITGDFSKKITNYTAPEIKENPGMNVVENSKKLLKADIFSVGIMILELYLLKNKPDLAKAMKIEKKQDLHTLIQAVCNNVPRLFLPNFYSMLSWDWEMRMSLEMGSSIIELSTIIESQESHIKKSEDSLRRVNASLSSFMIKQEKMTQELSDKDLMIEMHMKQIEKLREENQKMRQENMNASGRQKKSEDTGSLVPPEQGQENFANTFFKWFSTSRNSTPSIKEGSILRLDGRFSTISQTISRSNPKKIEILSIKILDDILSLFETGKIFYELMKTVRLFTNLKHLNLDFSISEFNREGVPELSKLFASFATLNELELVLSMIDSDLLILAGGLQNSSQLNNINIVFQYCMFTDIGIKAFVNALLPGKNLKKLILTFERVIGKGIENINLVRDEFRVSFAHVNVATIMISNNY